MIVETTEHVHFTGIINYNRNLSRIIKEKLFSLTVISVSKNCPKFLHGEYFERCRFFGKILYKNYFRSTVRFNIYDNI